MELFNGDCLNILPQLEDDSIDLFFTDLPYGQISCNWDNKINLEEMWIQLNRVCKINCPMFFTCTTKFGIELINSNPKNFRYDIVWCKNTSSGFLLSKKQPLRKHEMIYVFYRKQPFYNIDDNHTKKVIISKKKSTRKNSCYDIKEESVSTYSPPLPNTILKEDNNIDYKAPNVYSDTIKRIPDTKYEPPLPESILEIKRDSGKLHQTQKPVKLMEWILKYYSKESDTVLDCCMGSGSMGVACKNLNRNFIGIELDDDIFKNAAERLN